MPSTRDAIISPDLGPSAGPFSHAVRAGELLYCSGQIGADPATGHLAEGGAAAQTRQALKNLETVLRAAGKTFDHVVKANVYLTTIEDFAAMNAVYAETFAKPYPARTTVAVAGLPQGAAVEIELVVR